MKDNFPVLTLPEKVAVFVTGAAASLVFLKVQGASLMSAVPPREMPGALLPFLFLGIAMGAIAALLAAGAIVGAGALWSISRSRFLKKSLNRR